MLHFVSGKNSMEKQLGRIINLKKNQSSHLKFKTARRKLRQYFGTRKFRPFDIVFFLINRRNFRIFLRAVLFIYSDRQRPARVCRPEKSEIKYQKNALKRKHINQTQPVNLLFLILLPGSSIHTGRRRKKHIFLIYERGLYLARNFSPTRENTQKNYAQLFHVCAFVFLREICRFFSSKQNIHIFENYMNSCNNLLRC